VLCVCGRMALMNLMVTYVCILQEIVLTLLCSWFVHSFIAPVNDFSSEHFITIILSQEIKSSSNIASVVH